LSLFQGFLSFADLERADRFRFGQDRRDFILTRGMLRVLISRYVHTAPERIDLIYSPSGQPTLAGAHTPPLKFSLSHSRDLVLYAFALETPVGIDVEFCGYDLDFQAIAGAFFDPEEQQFLESVPGADRGAVFFRLWSFKEAYLKARGLGLSTSMPRYSIGLPGPGRSRVVVSEDAHGPLSPPREWLIQSVEVHPEYLAAVAAEGTGWSLQFWEVSPPASGNGGES
ncbi:MAG: 4'-phosphopantetheinyl transferase superfamily protein, partial [Calditrichaeota bacterium]